MNISIVNTRAMKDILALNVVVPVTIKKMKMIFQNAFKMKTYPFPVICEPECYPLGLYGVEPCNCLCYQDEIEDLELDCNDVDDDFWMDRRDYRFGALIGCSTFKYNLPDLPTTIPPRYLLLRW